jgi:hypothetical protein
MGDPPETFDRTVTDREHAADRPAAVAGRRLCGRLGPHGPVVRRPLADHHGIERVQPESSRPGRPGEVSGKADRQGEPVEADGGYRLA